MEDIRGIIRRNKNWLSEVRHIGFTGGEPLLREDLVPLVQLFRQELPQAQLGFQTNGLLPQRFYDVASEILSFYPKLSLAVSLDGIGKTHDYVRGRRNAYEKSLKTLKAAGNLGIKDITVGMTLTALNYQEIPKVKELVESFGAEFSCFLADESDYFNNKGKVKELSAPVKEAIADLLSGFKYHYFMDNLRLQLLGKRKRKLPCYSGWTSLVIDPFGEVKPCILRQESFGNLRETNLGKMLKSKNARKIREIIKECSCWNQCEVSTSAVVDPLDVIKWFFFFADKKEFIRRIKPKLKRYR